MAAGPQELTGPDLCAGVRLEELAEGVPLAGHAEGQAALLVRRGDEVHAIGASCTHYGGPLAEGLVTGDTIRCPWHHACFSLRTGEAVAAPALNPVSSWCVEVEDGVARVLPGALPVPLPDRSGADDPATVAIVGAGAAGSAAAEALRAGGYAGRVVLIDPDADAPYDRPNLSKDYLAGSAPEEWIPLRPAGWHAEHGIERLVVAVTAIDPGTRRLTLSDGAALEYDALLLATGATPIRLPLDGADGPHVHVLRSLADCRALIRGAEGARRAVIVGASFIGMEAAASLRARGLEVTVVAPEEVPFARTLGPELGAMLRSAHERHGVAFRLGRKPVAIGADAVTLDDGTRVDADLVLLGVGVRPDLRLAEAAGLALDDGVVVDEYLRSSVAGVWAAGDIARFPNARGGPPIRVEHWVVAERQGQAAARNILGAHEAFDSVPFFWTTQYDATVVYVGHAGEWQRTHIDGDPLAGDCRVDYVDGDVVRAVATVGRDRESLRAEVALEVA